MSDSTRSPLDDIQISRVNPLLLIHTKHILILHETPYTENLCIKNDALPIKNDFYNKRKNIQRTRYMVGLKLAPYLTENSENYVNRKSLQIGTLDDASFKTSANLDSYIINRVNRSMTK